MADILTTPGGIPNQTTRRYHDEGDGTYSEANAAHLFYWTGSAWAKWDGTIQTGDIEIGAVELKDATTTNRAVIDSSGALSVNQAKVAGTVTSVNNGTVDAGTQRVTIASDSTGTVNTELPTAAALADGAANPTVPNVGSNGLLWNGSNWDRAPGTVANGAYVQGAVASGVADTGNPLKIGGKYLVTRPTFADGQRGDLQIDTRGSLAAHIVGRDASGSGATLSFVSDDADTAAATSNAVVVKSRPSTYNGTNWDAERGNWNKATGDTGAKATGAFLGATQTNYDSRGAYITCLLGTVTGAITTFQTGIQWSFDGGTTWLELTPLGANDTAASTGKTYTWFIYPTNISQSAGTTPATLVPGTISVSGPTQLNVVNAPLPRTWRFAAQITVATSIVITSVNVNYIR